MSDGRIRPLRREINRYSDIKHLPPHHHPPDQRVPQGSREQLCRHPLKIHILHKNLYEKLGKPNSYVLKFHLFNCFTLKNIYNFMDYWLAKYSFTNPIRFFNWNSGKAS